MKILFSLIFGIIAIAFSCNKKQVDGECSHNIKLSQETVTVAAAVGTVTITSDSRSWWLAEIALNNQHLDLENLNGTAQDFVIMTPDFTVERKNGQTIIITLNQNTTGAERVLFLGLQDGNCFNSIRVTQVK